MAIFHSYYVKLPEGITKSCLKVETAATSLLYTFLNCPESFKKYQQIIRNSLIYQPSAEDEGHAIGMTAKDAIEVTFSKQNIAYYTFPVLQGQ